MNSKILLAISLLALAAAFVLSGRPFFPTVTSRVQELAVLPDGPQTADVRRYTDYGSGILPYNPKEHARRAPQEWADRPPLKIGISYAEVSFVKLPLFAWEEYGIVTFFDRPTGFQIAILAPEQVKMLGERTGKDWRGAGLRLWQHLWGWLIVAGFIGVLVLQWREQRRWREAEGII